MQARRDYPPDGDCEVAPAAVVSPLCMFAAAPSTAAAEDSASAAGSSSAAALVRSAAAPTENRIVLLGDSHAGQWFSAVSRVAADRHLAVEELVKQGCPPADLTVTNSLLGREYHECDAWRAATLDRLAHEPRPALIVVAQLNWYAPDVAAAWDRTLTRLAALGAPIAYLRDTPKPDRDIPVCISGSQEHWSDCAFPRAKALMPDATAADPRVTAVDLDPVLCPAAACPAVLDGVLLYRDDSHLTNAAAYVLAARLAAGLPFDKAWHALFRSDFTGPDGAPPSANDWLVDTGHCYPGCPVANWGTGELEAMSADPANVRLDGHGHLVITPIRAPDGTWTSGRLETRRSDFQPPPGGVLRLKARIQLPNVTPADGAGYWPAFWALGSGVRDGSQPWPGGGEIDVLEGLDGRPSVSGTLHCGSLPVGLCHEPAGLTSGEHPCPACDCAFHDYAVEVDFSRRPEQIRWYLDGVEYFRVAADRLDPKTWNSAVHHGLFAVFDVAIGGSFPGGPGPATASGRPMVIDSLEVSTRSG